MFNYSELAALDLADIYEYTYLNYGEQQANKYTNEIEKKITFASEMPSVGRKCDQLMLGARRLDLRHHAVFYIINHDGLLVIRILHQSSDYAHQFDA